MAASERGDMGLQHVALPAVSSEGWSGVQPLVVTENYVQSSSTPSHPPRMELAVQSGPRRLGRRTAEHLHVGSKALGETNDCCVLRRPGHTDMLQVRCISQGPVLISVSKNPVLLECLLKRLQGNPGPCSPYNLQLPCSLPLGHLMKLSMSCPS